MIITMVINQLLLVIEDLILVFASPVRDFLIDASTNFISLQVPVIIYDVIALSIYFLPIGTILSLAGITLILITVNLVLAFIRWFVHAFGVI